MDSSERQPAEENNRKSELRYQTLFETLIEGFCTIEMIFDATGKAVDYRFLEKIASTVHGKLPGGRPSSPCGRAVLG